MQKFSILSNELSTSSELKQKTDFRRRFSSNDTSEFPGLESLDKLDKGKGKNDSGVKFNSGISTDLNDDKNEEEKALDIYMHQKQQQIHKA